MSASAEEVSKIFEHQRSSPNYLGCRSDLPSPIYHMSFSPVLSDAGVWFSATSYCLGRLDTIHPLCFGICRLLEPSIPSEACSDYCNHTAIGDKNFRLVVFFRDKSCRHQ
ncbi:hypothetical protein AVEN_21601-1 [Araneus ventricosus]|uniref:Uncharacterized protein n=1 Tax=Araneus ventricosus TaxID=182803 RepID=A0A4Y2P5V6_ARAVE|nr:hypothetical protein AVEN_21601-1 [Araneus ventricosus]